MPLYEKVVASQRVKYKKKKTKVKITHPCFDEKVSKS
jgi:hypothetical protein